MKDLNCISATALDKKLAKSKPLARFGENEHIIAGLRSLYDMTTSENSHFLKDKDEDRLSDAEVFKFALILDAFAKATAKKETRNIRNAQTNLATAFLDLVNAYSHGTYTYYDGDRVHSAAEVVKQRAEAIAIQISEKAEEEKIKWNDDPSKKKKITRQDVLRGFKSAKTGKPILGEMELFSQLYEDYFSQYMENLTKSLNGNDEIASYKSQELKKILDNWGALCMYARVVLQRTEGLKLGAFNNYAARLEMEDLEGVLWSLENMDAEESTKESWMERKDRISSFNSLGLEVRSIISNIHKPSFFTLKNGAVYWIERTDDLGNPILVDPMYAHNALRSLFRGMPSKRRMMAMLEKEASRHDRLYSKIGRKQKVNEEEYFITHIYKSIYDHIKADPVLQTKFFTNYKKGFTPYSEIKVGRDGGFNTFNSISLNRTFPSAQYEYDIKLVKGQLDASFLYKGSAGALYVKGPSEISQLRNQLLAAFGYQESGSTEKFKEGIKKGVNGFLRDVRKAIKTEDEEGLNSAVQSVQSLLSPFGINITEADFKVLHRQGNLGKFINSIFALYDPSFFTSGSSIFGGIRNLETGKVEEYKNTFWQYYTSKEGADFRKKLNSVFRYIDDATANMSESRARIRDKNGKMTTVFSDQNPCFFTDTIDTIMDFIKSDDKQGLITYLTHKYLNSSYFYTPSKDGQFHIENVRNIWLREWLSGKEDSFSTAAYMLQHNRFAQMSFGHDTLSFENISSKQHALALLQSFFYSGSTVEDRRYSYYPLFILGDSGVARFLKAPNYSTEQIVDYFVEVFEQEFDMKRSMEAVDEALRDGNISIENKLGTGKVVHLGGLSSARDYAYRTLEFLGSREEIEELKDKGTEAIRKKIKEKLEEKVEAFKQKLEKLGLLDLAEVKQGKNKVMAYTQLGKLNYFDGNSDVIVTPDNLTDVLSYYYYNSMFAMSQQLQLMTVSSNFYKSIEDLQKRYKEIHASGTPLDTSAAYRTASGETVSVFNGRATERAMYFDDTLINSYINHPNFYKAAEAVTSQYKDYLENTLTDGQSYRTIDSYRKIAIAQGLWDLTGPEEVLYQKLLYLRKHKTTLSKQDMRILSKLSVVLQPQKPYLYTFEKFKYAYKGETGQVEVDELLIPVQHKCAEVILIPELLADGTPLKYIAEIMTESNIDVLCSTEVVKVGNFGATELMYATNEQGLYINSYGEVIPAENEKMPTSREEQKKNPLFNTRLEGTTDRADRYMPVNLSSNGKYTKEAFRNALSKGYVHELSLETYYRQQNVPEHTYDSRSMGTQLRKVFFDKITAAGRNYERYLTTPQPDGDGTAPTQVNIGGSLHDLSNAGKNGGRNLARFYNSLIVANILESFDGLIKEIGTSDKLSKALQQMVINSSNETYYHLFDYALTGDVKFLVPLFEGCIEHDTSNKIISWFKKRVQKQKMCGGSAVQASAFGISEIVEDMHRADDGNLDFIYEEYVDTDGETKTNIVGMQCEIPWDLRYTDALGNEISLDYDKYCFTKEDAKNGLGLEGTLRPDPDNPSQSLLEKEFPGILDLVAYRIPTERAYSMMALKVKRFSRKEMGGTIKIPAEGTTIAGFDFDIDKLYFLRKEFKARPIPKGQNSQYWREIYKAYPEIKDVLKNAQELDTLDPATKNTIASFISNIFGESMEKATSRKEPFEFLYQYWEESGLTEELGMTASQFFSKYMKDHAPIIFDEYVYSKDVLENSLVSRNNEILNLIIHRLQDPETLESRLTPGGFEEASLAAKKMRIVRSAVYAKEVMSEGQINRQKLNEMAADKSKSYKEAFDVLDPMTIVTYNQQNQIAGTLIGIFANHNCNHMFASLAKSMRLVTPISFCGKSFSDLIHPQKGTDPSLTMAEFLAASVDAVKNPVLNFLMLNRNTANTASLLGRLGYSSEEIGLLFNQPIIRDLCDLLADNSYLDINGAIEELKTKYGIPAESELKTNNPLLSAENLYANIGNYAMSGEDATWIKNNLPGQIAVLTTFSYAAKAANELSQFVNSTKMTAANAIGSTWGDLYHLLATVQKYIETQESGQSLFHIEASDYTQLGLSQATDLTDSASRKDYFNKLLNNPFAFEQCVFDSLVSYMKSLCEKYYPYESPMYQSARNLLSNITRSQLLDAETINSIHDDIAVWYLSTQKGSIFDGSSLIQPDGFSEPISRRDYYLNSFPLILKSILDTPGIIPESTRFKLEEMIQFIPTNADASQYSISLKGMMRMSTVRKNEFSDLWSDLATSTNGVASRALARDLFLYCFFKQGFNFSTQSFLHLAPPSVKQLLTIDNIFDTATGTLRTMDYLQGLTEAMTNGDFNNASRAAEFARLFIRNHSDNYRYVYEPRKSSEIDIFENRNQKKKNVEISSDGSTITLQLDKNAEYYHKVVLASQIQKGEKTGFIKVIPAIMWKGELYEVDLSMYPPAENGNFNEIPLNPTDVSQITYRKVNNSSVYNQSLSYSLSEVEDQDLDGAYSTENPYTFMRRVFEEKITIRPEDVIIDKAGRKERRDVKYVHMELKEEERLYLNEKGELVKRCK